ncbi:MAG TPA: hypothetical protein VEL82_06045 [Thermoplasmata archaeon]|nr:hypothetical protein [Thermoplasmata archaeon]
MPRAKSKPPPEPEPDPPKGFRIVRDLPVGRHPLLAAFPGLEALPIARRLEPDPARRERMFEDTCIEVVDADMWMYVAPWDLPPQFKGRWRPVVAPGSDCIVVGQSHLRDSPALVLFMDIYHELCHVRQRRGGANLWEPGVRYVDRWTEIEAYRLVVDEARELGVSDRFLRDYLKVEWISAAEHRVLLGTLGVPAK